MIRSENDYEDLLSQWSDLESGLGILLAQPGHAREFVRRVGQYDRWLQSLLRQDTDVGLYLLFQLAVNSPVGYSAAHALVCATLCHLIATELGLAAAERDALVPAALTMNVAMTAMQDVLATQEEKPSPQQREAIRVHPAQGAMMLSTLGVANGLWIHIVNGHHDELPVRKDLLQVDAALRLTRILQVVDRYAAMISPRHSRSGRDATESAKTVLGKISDKSDVIGHTLLRCVGLCPPGTYVQLDNGELAVVVHRGGEHNHPYVAIVGKVQGDTVTAPRLHNTHAGAPRIRAALLAGAVRQHLNHFHILQLGAGIAAAPA